MNIEDDRTALSKEALKNAFLDDLFYVQGKFPALATKNDYYMALAYAVRDRMLQRWISTAAIYTKQASRTVAYLSAEFLMGPHLGNNLINLGHLRSRQAVHDGARTQLRGAARQEEEPGLGNGGLGRFAACFIDSLATLEVPAVGYGIRYEFGIFHQDIVDGWQVEKTDKWLRFGNPWELVRPEWAVEVKFGGTTESYIDEHNRLRVRWVPQKTVIGVPYDTPSSAITPIPPTPCGCGGPRRRSPSISPMFNSGDYYGAVNQKGRPRRTSARCSIRTTSSCAARSCGSSSNISSCPVPCRT